MNGFSQQILYVFYLFIPTSSRNLGLLSLISSHEPNHHLDGSGWPWINTTDPSSVSLAEYREWYSHHSAMVGPNITDCSLEEEMNKVSLRYSFNELCLYGDYQDNMTCFTKMLIQKVPSVNGTVKISNETS